MKDHMLDQNTFKPGGAMLRDAAESGNIDLIRIILDAGVDINEQSKIGTSALMRAVRFNQVECVKFLLANRADPSLADEDGYTALSLATSSNQSESIVLLVHGGANINALSGTDIHPRTQLMRAAMHKENESMKTLIELGADLHFVSEDGKNALDIALLYQNIPGAHIIRTAIEAKKLHESIEQENYNNWIEPLAPQKRRLGIL